MGNISSSSSSLIIVIIVVVERKLPMAGPGSNEEFSQSLCLYYSRDSSLLSFGIVFCFQPKHATTSTFTAGLFGESRLTVWH